MKDTIYVSNSTQNIISLNCSYMGPNDTLVPCYHDIPPARQCIGKAIPRADWERVKKLPVIRGMIDNGFLLPEKRKVTIDQETDKVSDPQPTGELAEAAKPLRDPDGQSVAHIGSRSAKTKLASK